MKVHGVCGYTGVRSTGPASVPSRPIPIAKRPIMQLTDMTWPAIDALDRNAPVVMPIAALEQHGHHLPLFTDSMLLGEVVRRASKPLEDKVLFAPLFWL